MNARPEQRGRRVICNRCKNRYRIPTAAESQSAKRASQAKKTRARSNTQKYDGCAITGFILGLVAFLLTTFEIPVVPILAVIVSGFGIDNTGPGKRKGRTLAVIGLILGIIFVGMAILVATGTYKP